MPVYGYVLTIATKWNSAKLVGGEEGSKLHTANKHCCHAVAMYLCILYVHITTCASKAQAWSSVQSFGALFNKMTIQWILELLTNVCINIL